MRYDIETLAITGANRYGRTSVEMIGLNLKGIEGSDLEKVLCSLPSSDGFELTAKLPIPLEARVLRNLKPGREIVRLNSGNRMIDLFRGDSNKLRQIGASCDPHGDEVDVEAINLKFRNYDDRFTDRGFVWVYPGTPASMSFVIKAKALGTPGTATKIVTAAEEIVRAKVLAYFQ